MRALILVDLQNDFCSKGALEVPNADSIIQIANKLQLKFTGPDDLIVATQDYHPSNHLSFASNNDAEVMSMGTLNGLPQMMWPDHCVWGSYGSRFHKDLSTILISAIFRKGMHYQVDSYSGFFDNAAIINAKRVRRPTGMGGYLRDIGVTETYIMGLATDVCVKFTAKDSMGLGFTTNLITDGCRGVCAEDSKLAIEELKKVGVNIITSEEVKRG